MALNNRRTGLVLSYTSTVLNMVCGLLLSSVLLRTLGDFEYGLYQTVYAFANYLVIFEFGMGTVLCRNLLLAQQSNDPEERKRITATVWYITVILSALILAIGAIFYANMDNIYAKTVPADRMADARGLFAILLVYMLVSFFTQTLSGTYLGNENYNIGSIINIAKTVSRAVILVVAVHAFRHSAVIALVDVAVSVCVLAFTLVYVRRTYGFSFDVRRFDGRVLKTSLPLCLALLVQAIVNQAGGGVAKFIISIRMSMEAVSLYSVSVYICNLFASLTTVPVTVYRPRIAQTVNGGADGQALTDVLVAPGRLVALVGGTVLFGFAAVGRPFIRIVYGDAYELSHAVALLMLLPAFVSMTGESATNALDMVNKRHVRSLILLFTTVLNIGLTVLLVGKWGVLGAAVASVVSTLLGQVLISNIYYRRALSLRMLQLYAASWRGIVPAEILAMLVGGSIGYLIPHAYLSLVCGGLAFVAAEFGFLFLFGWNDREKRQVKHLLRKMSHLDRQS